MRAGGGGMGYEKKEMDLIRELMSGYMKSVRPCRHSHEPVDVSFGLALTQIIDVDERNQILTTNCWLKEVWKDYGLQWNASEYENVTVVRIPYDQVWKPDIILYNNADSQYSSAVLSTNVIVKFTGEVAWLSSAIFKSSCQINVEFFPFDEQRCSMKFASWTYGGDQVNLLRDTEEGDLTNYVKNGEWDLIEMKVERSVQYYSCCSEPYPDITYTIVLRRRPLFYVFNLILPCVLITGVALLSFYMPSDSGEKVTLGITTLLSMTVFLMVIGESMPPTSEKLPLIGLYYGVTISLVSFATGLSVVTLNIHHRGMRGREVPGVVKKIVFGFLAKLMWIRLDPPDHLRLKARARRSNSECPYSEIQMSALSTMEMAQSSEESMHFKENGGVTPRFNRRMALGGESFERQFLRVLNKVYQTIEKNDSRLAEQDRRDTIRLEWQQVALVIDRLLLWVFIVATIGATFGILYMSPHTKLFTM
ncbi:unnamed protein product [Darwinula stevensoni]|uniref:Neuronal acetylcholine receptor subunit alpha-10-like n=1 Tax=Darwinula stevensoni TaxID=69355 RepID=A0A7R8X8V8_9CRUS|nr:unnamed protein product [Darwinula stevensoni]CAG0890050.1 unnamed protein product [Darwinula stevensoni]